MSSEKKYKYVLPKGFVLKGGENDYVIEEVLGKGGFGVTYKVRTRVLYRNIKIDAYFAVKEYFPHICSREADNVTIKIPETMQDEVVDGKKDFINEGLKLQEVCKLNPNIVNVNEVFEANGTAYYVLEYLEGGDLRKMVLDNGKPLSEQQMLEIMTPIGHALQCLHDNRMLHLDIKPDNVVMRIDHADGSAEPVLIDFGISAHFNIDGTPTSKTPSQGVSPGYSPIEQYDKVDYFDPRIDVYAFCATCFYLLTGKDPIVAMEMTSDYIRNRMPSGISANVVQALERGMTMSKNARTATIEEVLKGLQGIKELEVVPKETDDSNKNTGEETMKLDSFTDTNQLSSGKNDSSDNKPAQSSFDTIKSGEKNTDKAIKDRDMKNLFIVVAALFGFIFLGGGLYWGAKSCSSSRDQVMQSDTSYISVSEKVEQTASESAPALNETIKDYIDNMVYVEGGTFEMGATNEQGSDAEDDENPTHSVTLSSYYIGQTEVTQELWEAVMGSNPSEFKGAKRPVENVSWEDCQEFISKLNEMTGKNFRLPTEAEWEYAARGGNKSQRYKYSGSSTIGDVAWYADNSYEKGESSPDFGTQPVAIKSANELGIYDMTGNVEEWCSDWYGEEYYKSSPSNNPQGPSTGSCRVVRGGDWRSAYYYCRVSCRDYDSPGERYNLLGLRLAR